MSEPLDLEEPDGIAIIGMSGRFPGAGNYREFWDNLVNCRESISFFSKEELSESGIDVSEIGPNHVAARSLLKDADHFDAAFFGFSARAAELMDPQHRLLHEVAYESLEDAGYAPDRMSGPVGVYAGSSPNTYYTECLLSNPACTQEFKGLAVQLGNGNDYLATRLSYALNLTGPSLTVQTACSTALVAVSQACQSLLLYQCDYALAGAVSIAFPQKQAHVHQEGGIYSADGHCRPFDANATGTVFGDGLGVVTLKRLSDALRDGDSIRAVIKGFALNNDGGDKSGYTAPSVRGQAAAIEMAQAMAGIPPESITYIEAHGTATPLGDPIEIAALSEAFAKGTNKTGFCRIGSVKGNVGHLDIAAGMAGLIKASLCLSQKGIPQSLHFKKANPRIDFEASPFKVADQYTEWTTTGGYPRRAGVSAFGIGGTNVHVVLEEAPDRTRGKEDSRPRILLLSARSPLAVHRATVRLKEHLERNQELRLDDVAFTLQVGRQRFKYSRTFQCKSIQDAISQLGAASEDRPAIRERIGGNPSIVFMFPGQGAQQVGMGRELYETRSLFREIVNECAAILQPKLNLDLREVLFPTPDKQNWAEDLIGQTWITQPALFVIEYATAKLMMSLGLRPNAMIGHSVGEYVAACLSGVFSLQNGLRLIAERGRLIQEMPKGTMLAVRLAEQRVRELIGSELSVAAVNAAELCVVSGPDDEIEALEQRLTADGTEVRKLRTSHAFHSVMMESAANRFREVCEGVELHEPQIPYISNLSGNWIKADEPVSPEYWAKHIREAVRFSEGATKLLESTYRVFVEIGPGSTLTSLVRQQKACSSDHLVLPSMAGRSSDSSDSVAFLSAVGRLWQLGLQINWSAVHESKSPRRVSLPTYPFERKRFFVEVASPKARAAKDSRNGKIRLSGSEQVIETKPVGNESSVNKIVRQAIDKLCELSGVDRCEIDQSATFTDQGFDSLFLSLYCHHLETEFGISIEFPRLVNDLSSIDKLAAHITASVPAQASTELDHAKPWVASAISAVNSELEVENAPDIARLQSELEALSREVKELNRVIFGSSE